MNIVICDDDDKVIKNVANVCRNVLLVKSKISAFRSAESLIQNLTNDEELVDLFILDIEMPGKNGLWLKKELEQYRYGSSIIFLTSHDEMIQEAFGRYVIGFVDKVSFDKNTNALADKLRLFEQVESGKRVVNLKDELGSFCIQYDRIIKIMSEHVYTYIEYTTGKIVNGLFMTDKKLVRRSLKDWEVELGNSFLRISKSCIVNMEYIQRLDHKVILKDGSEISIPRSNINKCRDCYFEFCKTKMKWN